MTTPGRSGARRRPLHRHAARAAGRGGRDAPAPSTPARRASRRTARSCGRATPRIARQYGAKAVADFTAASNGFVADLTGEQAVALSSDRRVLLVEKSQTLKLDTWHSPKFLGLTGKDGAWTTHGGGKKAGPGWSSPTSTAASGRSRSRSPASG